MGGEAGVGVHGLVGGLLSVGVLGQEGHRRVGGGRLGLGVGLRVAGALVAHVLGWVQLLWMPPRVLRGMEKRNTMRSKFQKRRFRKNVNSRKETGLISTFI